jgi:hypothetical protein
MGYVQDILNRLLEGGDDAGLLLLENRVEQARAILAEQPTILSRLLENPYANHKYLVWMAGQIAQLNFSLSQAEQLLNAVQIFDRYKVIFQRFMGEIWAHHQLNDLQQWKARDLIAIASQVERYVHLNRARPTDSDLETLLDNGRYWVVRAKTHPAAVWFAHRFQREAQDARWCIAAYDSDGHYRKHNTGTSMVLVWDKARRIKSAIAPGIGYWDAENKIHYDIDEVLDPKTQDQLHLAPAVERKRHERGVRLAREQWYGSDTAGEKNMDWDWLVQFARKAGINLDEPNDLKRLQTWLSIQVGIPIRMRVQAMLMALAHQKGASPEDGLERFLDDEDERLREYTANFVTSNLNP